MKFILEWVTKYKVCDHTSIVDCRKNLVALEKVGDPKAGTMDRKSFFRIIDLLECNEQIRKLQVRHHSLLLSSCILLHSCDSRLSA